MAKHKLDQINEDVLATAAMNGARVILQAVRLEGQNAAVLLPPTQEHTWKLVETLTQTVTHVPGVQTAMFYGVWTLSRDDAMGIKAQIAGEA